MSGANGTDGAGFNLTESACLLTRGLSPGRMEPGLVSVAFARVHKVDALVLRRRLAEASGGRSRTGPGRPAGRPARRGRPRRALLGPVVPLAVPPDARPPRRRGPGPGY